MFLDLSGPVCFGPWWSGVFRTSVVRCVSDLGGPVCFRPWWSGVFSDLDGPVHFRTSVVNCILDLGGQLRLCST